MMLNKGYSHLMPFDSGYLDVGSIHRIWFEQYGDPKGKPVVFLHGGPGGNTSKDSCRFFNPDRYRVVLFDQRGAGKSLPKAELQDNTTQHLIEDIETLRHHIGIQKWHIVFGGSWGSTLALAYAQTHPDTVGSLVMSGILTGEPVEIDRLTLGTVSGLFYPEEYKSWLEFLPEEDRSDPLLSYYNLLTSDDPSTRLAAAQSWNRLELRMTQLVSTQDMLDKVKNDDWALSHARLEAHYFVNKCFLTPGQLLAEDNTILIRGIPTFIVQGRYDMVCVPAAAWALHLRLPQSKLYWIQDSGHTASEHGINEKLREICDNLS